MRQVAVCPPARQFGNHHVAAIRLEEGDGSLVEEILGDDNLAARHAWRSSSHMSGGVLRDGPVMAIITPRLKCRIVMT
jgi:hypothetical protein